MTSALRAGVALHLPTVDDTEALGTALAGLLKPGDLVVLDGPLGAGKTALARGLGRGLGVAGITSPTFVMARIHRGGRIPLVHVDAYRLTGLDDLDALDLDASLDESVTVVEWGAGVVESLAAEHLVIHLARSEIDETRTASLHPHGATWHARLA